MFNYIIGMILFALPFSLSFIDLLIKVMAGCLILNALIAFIMICVYLRNI